METLFKDIRCGLRSLFKRPGFTVVAVFILTLGIGANTAIFSIVNTVLLRPLPFGNPDRITIIWRVPPPQAQVGFDRFQWSAFEFGEFVRRNQSYAAQAAFKSDLFNLTEGGEPVRVDGIRVSFAFFNVLGVQSAIGRTFLDGEDQAGQPKIVVLSHGLWQHRFGGDRALVGKTIQLNSEAYTVVGIAPPGFAFPGSSAMPANFQFPPQPQLWVPLELRSNLQPDGLNDLFVIGRLKDHVTLVQESADMATLTRQLEEKFPQGKGWFGFMTLQLKEQVVGKTGRALWVLLGAVGLVLLIVCANLANLLLARSMDRRREVAIRVALGAPRARLIRQLLTESLLLSIAGGIIGFAFAQLAVGSMTMLGANSLPRLSEISVDFRVFGFALLLTLVTGIISGVGPALEASKVNLNETLKEGSRRSVGSPSSRRFQSVLVIAEVALSLVLLVGAGLLIRSFRQLLHVNPGFDAQKVMTLEVTLPAIKYHTDSATTTLYKQTLDHVQATPGIDSASIVSPLPMSGAQESTAFTVEDSPPQNAAEVPTADYTVISPDYFRAMSISVLEGRSFSDSDGANAPPVVIVSQTMARKFWPNGKAVGRRIHLGGPTSGRPWMNVIGVVADVRRFAVSDAPNPEMYVSYQQKPYPSLQTMSLVVRGKSDPLALVGSVRQAVAAADPQLPIAKLRTMNAIVDESMKTARFLMMLLTIFAGTAMTLAMVGLYGVMSFAVTQRTQEFGLRMALGATSIDVVNLVVRNGMILTLVGIAIGLIGALGLSQLLRTLLFGVTPTDAPTFIAVSGVLTVVALFACYLPARRATKVDPLVALRYE